MPSYPIPPWLVPQSPVGPYLQGTALGARVGGEQAALEMQARQQALAEAARERSAALAEQDYTMRKAQADAEMAIRQRTASDIAAKEAMRMQAIKDIEAETGALGDQATPQDMARIYARHFPALTAGTGATALPGLVRDMSPATPQFTTVDFEGRQIPVAINPRTGTTTSLRPPTVPKETLTIEQQQRLKALDEEYRSALSEATNLRQESAKGFDVDLKRSTSRLQRAREDREKFVKSLASKVASAPAPAAAAPVPGSETKTDVSIDDARDMANEAIQRGADVSAVKARFKQLYGEDL